MHEQATTNADPSNAVEDSVHDRIEKAIHTQDKDPRRLKYGQKTLARISDGTEIDRTRVCFLLKESPFKAGMLTASDHTTYSRQPDGSLRRITPKETRQERRERKRRNRKES